MTAILFAFYHFRLSGLPGLIPVALILSYVVWRTNSLFAGMLIHFGMNATSAANTIAYLQGSPNGLGIINLFTALAGLAVALLLLVVIRLSHPVPTWPDEAAPTEPPVQTSWLGTYWPVIGAAALYLAVAVMTLAASVLGIGVHKELSYLPARVSHTMRASYQVTDRAGDVVGEMTCSITPAGESFTLNCSDDIQAYEVTQANSFYKDGTHRDTWSVTWDGQSLNIDKFNFTREADAGFGYQAELANSLLSVTTGGQTSARDASGVLSAGVRVALAGGRAEWEQRRIF